MRRIAALLFAIAAAAAVGAYVFYDRYFVLHHRSPPPAPTFNPWPAPKGHREKSHFPRYGVTPPEDQCGRPRDASIFFVDDGRFWVYVDGEANQRPYTEKLRPLITRLRCALAEDNLSRVNERRLDRGGGAVSATTSCRRRDAHPRCGRTYGAQAPRS